jgi:hypothetical protein
MSNVTPIATLSDAELDHVSAGTFSFNLVGIFAPRQTNVAKQTSFNGVAILSGNQSIQQVNNATIG